MSMKKKFPYNLKIKFPTEFDENLANELSHIIVLMEILRVQFDNLNALLHLSNFTSIPHKLDKIAKNTTKRRRKKR